MSDSSVCFPISGKGDMNMVVPGWVMTRTAEVIFEDDEDRKNVLTCIMDPLRRADVYLRTLS